MYTLQKSTVSLLHNVHRWTVTAALSQRAEKNENREKYITAALKYTTNTVLPDNYSNFINSETTDVFL